MIYNTVYVIINRMKDIIEHIIADDNIRRNCIRKSFFIYLTEAFKGEIVILVSYDAQSHKDRNN